MPSKVASRFDLNIRAETSTPDAWTIFSVLALSAIMIIPAVVYGIPFHPDLTNHLRFALPFHDAIQSGDLYPSWLAVSNSGYGDPSFRFYPPALYYLFATNVVITGNWYNGILLSLMIISMIGALGMYLWARSMLLSRAAMLAGIFFAVAPYRVNQLYQSSLLAEHAATSIIPFGLLFVERVCLSGNRRSIAGLAAAYALLLLTHLPLAVIGSIGLTVYAGLRIQHSEKAKSTAKLVAALCLGLAASAIYWITTISELRWIGRNNIHPDTLVEYHHNFLFSTLSSDNLNVWWGNLLALSTALLFAPAIAQLHRRHTRLRMTLKPAGALLLMAAFMTLPLSWPLWRILPPLAHTQFPWRWLAVVSIAGSLLAAAAVALWFQREVAPKAPIRLLIFGAVLISVVFTFSQTIREAPYVNQTQFEYRLKLVPGSASVNYWLPVWASPNPRAMEREIEISGRSVAIETWEPERRRFTVSDGHATNARVRTFYYPHWEAKTADQVLATWPAEDGALMIGVPEESTTIDLEFREPQRTRYAGMLSVIGWLFIVGLASPVRWRLK